MCKTFNTLQVGQEFSAALGVVVVKLLHYFTPFTLYDLLNKQDLKQDTGGNKPLQLQCA
jgi:hypothetical protein